MIAVAKKWSEATTAAVLERVKNVEEKSLVYEQSCLGCNGSALRANPTKAATDPIKWSIHRI
jgi:hypothetical protein